MSSLDHSQEIGCIRYAKLIVIVIRRHNSKSQQRMLRSERDAQGPVWQTTEFATWALCLRPKETPSQILKFKVS